MVRRMVGLVGTWDGVGESQVRAVYKYDKRVGKLTDRMELSRVMGGTASDGRNSLVTAQLNRF